MRIGALVSFEAHDGDVAVDGGAPLLAEAPRHRGRSRCSRARSSTGRARLLEDDGAVGTRPLDVAAADEDAAAAREIEPGGHAQQRRLAATRGSHHGDELAVGDGEAHLVDGDRLAEAAAHALEDDVAHAGAEPRAMRASAARSATSMRKPTMPIAIIPDMTIGVARLLCPCTMR